MRAMFAFFIKNFCAERDIVRWRPEALQSLGNGFWNAKRNRNSCQLPCPRPTLMSRNQHLSKWSTAHLQQENYLVSVFAFVIVIVIVIVAVLLCRYRKAVVTRKKQATHHQLIRLFLLQQKTSGNVKKASAFKSQCFPEKNFPLKTL